MQDQRKFGQIFPWLVAAVVVPIVAALVPIIDTRVHQEIRGRLRQLEAERPWQEYERRQLQAALAASEARSAQFEKENRELRLQLIGLSTERDLLRFKYQQAEAQLAREQQRGGGHSVVRPGLGIDWPAPVRSPLFEGERGEMLRLLGRGVKEAQAGRPPAALQREFEKGLEEFRARVVSVSRNEGWHLGRLVEAHQAFDQLEDAFRLLLRPGIVLYLSQ